MTTPITVRYKTHKPKRLMIMAAGTGGHIFPGLAIAETMQKRGFEIIWLGTTTGMEGEIVAQHNIPMETLEFTGMRGKGLQHSISGAFKLLISFIKCFQIFKKYRPEVVLGMGGYVTVPGGLMARLFRKPLVLMNADSALLLSNKLLAPFAQKVLFGFFADKDVATTKAVVTGNPIRQEISQITTPQNRYENRTGALKLLIVGGSLGAKVLNETIPAALALMPIESRPKVVHQSGKAHIEQLQKAYADAEVDAEIVSFIDDMAAQYAQADLVICRAGAITIAELTAAGVASFLVPFMASSTSHQRANAIWLSQHNAARHVPQNELTASYLAQLLNVLTRQQCQKMALAAYQVGRRDANALIANELENLIKKY